MLLPLLQSMVDRLDFMECDYNSRNVNEISDTGYCSKCGAYTDLTRTCTECDGVYCDDHCLEGDHEEKNECEYDADNVEEISGVSARCSRCGRYTEMKCFCIICHEEYCDVGCLKKDHGVESDNDDDW